MKNEIFLVSAVIGRYQKSIYDVDCLSERTQRKLIFENKKNTKPRSEPARPRSKPTAAGSAPSSWWSSPHHRWEEMEEGMVVVAAAVEEG
jgi:hypothetical protein